MPAIPKQCPVIVLHARANNDYNGNPRRCFVVLDHKGQHVETLDEGYNGSGVLNARWPWTNWHALYPYFDEPADLCCYPTQIDVPTSEYKRLLRKNNEPDERTKALRELGDRNARRASKQHHARLQA